jgi:hypothetical protein
MYIAPQENGLDFLDYELWYDICVFFAEIKPCSFWTACEAVSGDEANATACIGIGVLLTFCCVV